MESNEPASEEDLASLLPGAPETFIDFLVEDYGEKLVACIGQTSYDMLDTAEVEDVLQETLIEVWEKVNDPAFVPERPLRMVFTIAKTNSIDAYRRKCRFKRRICVDSELTDLVIADMQGSDLSLAWKYADESDKQRLPQLLPGILTGLPPRQKLAVLALKECLGEIRAKNKYKPIADAMSRLSGKPEDVAAVKSALRAGLAKIKSELVRLGIKFVEEK
jgi:DNA-directed RNA polymerase specialized sigma24 family protein